MGSLFSEQSTKAFSPPPNPPLGLVVKRMDLKKKKEKKFFVDTGQPLSGLSNKKYFFCGFPISC